MKFIILIITCLFVATFSIASDLSDYSMEEQIIIETIVSFNKDQEVVEISKGSNTNNKLVIELTHKMYVIDNFIIESIYILNDEDWSRVSTTNDTYFEEQELINNTAFLYDYNTPKEGKYIEIQPINGTLSWYLYYQDSFWDNRIQAIVYYNEDTTVIVGDSYVIYNDGLVIQRFELTKCK